MVDMTELILSWWLHFDNIFVYVTVHFYAVQPSSLLWTSRGLKIVPCLSKSTNCVYFRWQNRNSTSKFI